MPKRMFEEGEPTPSQLEHKKESGLPVPLWFIVIAVAIIVVAIFGPSIITGINSTTESTVDTTNSDSTETEQVYAGDGFVVPSEVINKNNEGIVVSYGQPAFIDGIEVQLNLLKKQKSDTVYISNIEIIGDKITFYVCAKEDYVTVATLHGALIGENGGNLAGSEAFVDEKGMNSNIPENGFVIPAKTKVKAEMSLYGFASEIEKINIYVGNY